MYSLTYITEKNAMHLMAKGKETTLWMNKVLKKVLGSMSFGSY